MTRSWQQDEKAPKSYLLDPLDLLYLHGHHAHYLLCQLYYLSLLCSCYFLQVCLLIVREKLALEQRKRHALMPAMLQATTPTKPLPFLPPSCCDDLPPPPRAAVAEEPFFEECFPVTWPQVEMLPSLIRSMANCKSPRTSSKTASKSLSS